VRGGCHDEENDGDGGGGGDDGDDDVMMKTLCRWILAFHIIT
jgi:hypothetical protein